MKSYIHTVQYYETDRMGITHHSNYVRWMEEARVDYLRQTGWGLEKLEEMGVVSPVVGLDCRFRQTTTFADEISITVRITKFTGPRFKLAYTMKNAAGKVVCEAESDHCFTDASGRIVRLDKRFPEFAKVLESLVCQE